MEDCTDELPDISEAALIAIELGQSLPKLGSRSGNEAVRKLKALATVCERLLCEIDEPGDDFAAKRIALSFTPRELVDLLLELSRRDWQATSHWQFKLQKRVPVFAMEQREKEKEKEKKTTARKARKLAFEREIHLRVTRYRLRTGASLRSALEAVAKSEDQTADLLGQLLGRKPLGRRLGVEKVKQAFHGENKRVAPHGVIIVRGGLLKRRRTEIILTHYASIFCIFAVPAQGSRWQFCPRLRAERQHSYGIWLSHNRPIPGPLPDGDKHALPNRASRGTSHHENGRSIAHRGRRGGTLGG
jgi:hypothetical protein